MTNIVREKNSNYTVNTESARIPTVTYGVVKEIYALGDECREAYGIAAYSNAEKDGTATIILSVNDITSDYDTISGLVGQLNENNVQTSDILDIVENFIS